MALYPPWNNNPTADHGKMMDHDTWAIITEQTPKRCINNVLKMANNKSTGTHEKYIYALLIYI